MRNFRKCLVTRRVPRNRLRIKLAARFAWLYTAHRMNRRRFLLSSIAAGAVAAAAPDGRVTVLLVDTDRVSTPIDQRIYGQFLEHINHSVEDGLFAEQIRGTGFEGPDFETYWTSFAERRGRGSRGRGVLEREEERATAGGRRARGHPAAADLRRERAEV